MLHFTNQELATANHVSVRTVRNWIEAAREGKLDLSLKEVGQRFYIENTSKNSLVIKDLVSKNKKYRPLRSQKTVMPQSKFYELYSQEQLYDLVANLEINHEIPLQYTYFGEGAKHWDEYVQRMQNEESPNTLKATRELLKLNEKYLDHLMSEYTQINVIDVGIGNGAPVKDFISHLQKQNKLGRYIGIDDSPEMLKIAETNIKKWFGDSIEYQGHVIDITQERFGFLLAEEYLKSDSSKTCNLFLFFGGTLSNFRKPSTVLEVIHDSMGVNDYLVHEQKLDSESSRKYFDFNPSQPTASLLSPQDAYIFNLLNIDESVYEVDMGYSTEQNERYIRVVLKVALAIRFSFDNGERTIHFNKGDKILLFRFRQVSLANIIDLFDANEFTPIQFSRSKDKQFLMTISSLNRDKE